MRFLKYLLTIPLLITMAMPAWLQNAGTQTSSILPKTFAGWQLSGSIKGSANAETADPVNAALLKEYGFSYFEGATYTRDDGNRLTIKAARFNDATGAYGAFTYYKMPQMLTEKIGDQGSSLNERVLFYRGNVLVDAVFQRLTAMSASELRTLASDLPPAPADAAGLPGLPAYLPRVGYVRNTAKYVVGPIGLQKIAAPLPAQFVDFASGAEVALGNYTSPSGEGTLMLISYPTPQMAAEHYRRIDAAAHQPANSAQQSGPSLANLTPLFEKRTGPIVAIMTGPVSESDAKSVLSSINYDANVTWNENTYVSKRDNIGSIVVNALILSGILMLFALALGLAFGGARILLKRFFPDRVFDRPERVEFISLHLGEGDPKG